MLTPYKKVERVYFRTGMTGEILRRKLRVIKVKE